MSQVAELVSETINRLSRQKEAIILQQLGDLVSKGFLVIESTEPVLVRDESLGADQYAYSMRQAVRLVLKDKEHILKLETENKLLKELLEKAQAKATQKEPSNDT